MTLIVEEGITQHLATDDRGGRPSDSPHRVTPGVRPRCATEKQFSRWMEAAMRVSGRGCVSLVSFCEDCTPEYEMAMAAAGRCNKRESMERVRNNVVEDV